MIRIIAATVFLLVFPALSIAGPYATASQRAAEWLESMQDVSDGSWRDQSEAKTFLQTAEALLALHQTNRRRAPYYAAQAWIENHDPHNLDACSRRLLVQNATQSSTQQDVDTLLASVDNTVAGQSGWGLADRYHSSALDTSLALNALRTAGVSFDSSGAIAYLRSTQLTATGNRGWPATAAGNTTDAYTTARVVQALAAYKELDPTLTTLLANAITTLKAMVSVSSAPHLQAAAAQAYLQIDPNSSDAGVLLDTLVSIQRADGGFDAGIFSTGLIAQSFATAEGTNAAADRERVDIPDTTLRQAINQTLGRASMDQLNRGELSQLVTLDISNRDISSLTGLQYAVNLTTLNAANNNISDTSPVTGLPNLVNSDFSGNPCPGCPQIASNDGDVPLPAWALVAMGAAFIGAARRAGQHKKNGV
jgi:hypothetical protein